MKVKDLIDKMQIQAKFTSDFIEKAKNNPRITVLNIDSLTGGALTIYDRDENL